MFEINIQGLITGLCAVACVIIGGLGVCRLIIDYIQNLAKRNKENRYLTDRHKQTTLWREILKLLDDSVSSCSVVNFEAIEDKFDSFEELSKAIKKAGLECSNLIIGVDFTASNEWQGRKTFEHKSLHHVFKNSKRCNPYQKVITSIGKTLAPFDEDNMIPAYGFGDKTTKDRSVFSLCDEEIPCKGFEEVLRCYGNVLQKIELSGPTSFAPIINKAIEITKQQRSYHILLIIADGQVVEEQELDTRLAITAASSYPLSIIVVGVGDGPWDVMSEYDEELPKRRFDNFQFVDYHKVTKKAKNPELAFALNALMEIPDQYKSIKNLGFLNTPTSSYDQ